MECVFLYVTASSEDEALGIGRKLVEEKLSACANVLPVMRSVYRWKGKIEEANESVLILKTKKSLADKASARIRILHSYECPCILVLPVTGGNPDFLKWISDETEQE